MNHGFSKVRDLGLDKVYKDRVVWFGLVCLVLVFKSHLSFFFFVNPNVFCNLRCIQKTALYNYKTFQAFIKARNKMMELTKNSVYQCRFEDYSKQTTSTKDLAGLCCGGIRFFKTENMCVR